MTTKTIAIDESDERFTELLADVAAGTEIVLTQGGAPVARIIPILAGAAGRTAGLHSRSMETTADFDEPLPDEFWTSAVSPRAVTRH